MHRIAEHHAPVPSISFPRIVEIPFEPCLAALESWWRREARGDELCVVGGRLLGPAHRTGASEAVRIHVLLVRRSAGYYRAGHQLLDAVTVSLWIEREVEAL